MLFWMGMGQLIVKIFDMVNAVNMKSELRGVFSNDQVETGAN